MLGETVANSLSGSSKAYSSTGSVGGSSGSGNRKSSGGSVYDAAGCRPGVVSVVDVQTVTEHSQVVSHSCLSLSIPPQSLQFHVISDVDLELLRQY